MTRRLKVAHVVTKLELGGAQQNTLYTVQHLDRDRFDPLLVCGRGGLLDNEAILSRVPVHFIPALVRSLHPFKDLWALWQLFQLFRREKPDIVHTHSSKAGILGRWAAHGAGVPVILHTFHGFGFNREQKPWTQKLFLFLERRTAKITTALIVVSQANQVEALSEGIGQASQYHLIRSGVTLERYFSISKSRQAPEGIPVNPAHALVMTMGPFKPQKNLGDFLHAAEVVLQRRQDVRFLIVGDGQLRPDLEKQIEQRGLKPYVLLAGWRRDIATLFSRADVFCLTSLWEGLPRSMIEAMAAGVPCVVNAVDGCQDVIEDGVNGFLVPPKHPLATADRILRLVEDSRLAQRMGERARQGVGQEFDIKVMVTQQEQLYKSLARRHQLGHFRE